MKYLLIVITIPTEVNVSNGQTYTFQFGDWVTLSSQGNDIYPGGRIYGGGAFQAAALGDLWFEAEIVDESANGGTGGSGRSGGSDSGCFMSTLVDH